MQNSTVFSTVYVVNRMVLRILLASVVILSSCSSPPKGAEVQQGSGDTAGDASDQSTDTPQSSKRPTVLFIGTSLTAGYGLDEADAFPAQVERIAVQSGYPIRAVNAGISGETSAGAVRRVGWALRTEADIVVLETGANDGLRGLSLSDLRTNIESILDSIAVILPQAHVILVQMETPPNMGTSYSSDFRALYREIAEGRGVTLAPFLLDGVAGITSMNLSDGIHPNRDGSQKVAENVWKTLHSVIKEVEK